MRLVLSNLIRPLLLLILSQAGRPPSERRNAPAWLPCRRASWLRALRVFKAAFAGVAIAVVSGFQYDGQWKRFAPVEAHLAVMMPGTPAHVRKSDDSAHGKIVQHTYGLKTRSGLLEILYADYPFAPDAESELQANRDQFIADTATKLVSESKINYRGNPGLEFRCENKDSIFLVRLYVMGRTVYELAGGGYRGQIDYEEISRFLNSFQVVEEKLASGRLQVSALKSGC